MLQDMSIHITAASIIFLVCVCAYCRYEVLGTCQPVLPAFCIFSSTILGEIKFLGSSFFEVIPLSH